MVSHLKDPGSPSRPMSPFMCGRINSLHLIRFCGGLNKKCPPTGSCIWALGLVGCSVCKPLACWDLLEEYVTGGGLEGFQPHPTSSLHSPYPFWGWRCDLSASHPGHLLATTPTLIVWLAHLELSAKINFPINPSLSQYFKTETGVTDTESKQEW